MPASIVTLCEAVKDFLNGESYSQAFTAARSNVPVKSLEETNSLVVEVFPGEYTVDAETRGDWRYEYTVNVAVSKVITAADRQTEEDGLLALAEEIQESLKDEAMGDFSMLTLTTQTGAKQHFNAERLLSAGQFVAVLEVVYVG